VNLGFEDSCKRVVILHGKPPMHACVRHPTQLAATPAAPRQSLSSVCSVAAMSEAEAASSEATKPNETPMPSMRADGAEVEVTVTGDDDGDEDA
jgi:hypothetical protein